MEFGWLLFFIGVCGVVIDGRKDDKESSKV